MATPRVEMAALLSSRRCGFITALDPHAIAKTLNETKLSDLNAMRKAALEAARTLNWEAEKSRLTAAIASLGRPLEAAR
jgi:hypothetical protein